MYELPMWEIVRAILVLIAALGIILLIANWMMREGEKDRPIIKVWKPEPGQNRRDDAK